MAYRAQVGGMFGSGINQKPQTGVSIDVAPLAGVIAQALASRRDGLIHKAMLQREYDRQDAMDAQAAAERQAAAAAQADERDYTRQRNDRLDSLAEAKQANETAKYRSENGVVPEQYAPAPGSDLVSSFQPPSIRSAYMGGGGAVGQFQAPGAAAGGPTPSVGAIPRMQLVSGFTDPTLGTKYKDAQAKADAQLQHIDLGDKVVAIHPTTGEIVRTYPKAVKPEKPAGGGQPSEGERKAAFYAARAEPSSKIIDMFDNATTLNTIASKAGMFGNWVKTKEGQQLDQAAKTWAMAVLRQDSGGAISKEEMDGYYDTYIPRPGDSEEVLAQKREARRVVTEGLRAIAGRAGRLIPSGGAGGDEFTQLYQKHNKTPGGK